MEHREFYLADKACNTMVEWQIFLSENQGILDLNWI